MKALKSTLSRIRSGLLALLLTFVQTASLAAPFVFTQQAAAASTGWLTPDSAHNLSGSNNDWDVNAAANVQVDDESYASDNDGDYQVFYDFNIPSFSSGTIIDGFEVRTLASSTDNSGCQLRVQLSWDYDDSDDRTGSKDTSLSNTFASDTLGGSNDTWGRTWTLGNLSNGSFGVVVQDRDPGNGCDNNATTYLDLLELRVHYTEPTPPVAPATNPQLGQSCGLDIALVLDVSSSINDTELGQMRSAMQSFVTAFTGTPTEFSITKFATTGEVVLSFTDDLSLVGSTLGAVDGSGYTNWDDGLSKALGTFGADRPGVPNMVVFASDGNPNTIGDGPANNASPDGSQASMDPAVTQANLLKTVEGAHVLSLGIGDELSTGNLERISGPGDVISSGFATLAQDLAELAEELCGGTITITKLIDEDGNLNDASDQEEAGGWEFEIRNQGGSLLAEPVTESGDGKTLPFEVDPANGYSVTEPANADFNLVSAICKNAAGATKGSKNGNAVTGINVTSSDVINCTFINTPKKGGIELKKVWDGGQSQTTLRIGTTGGGTDVASKTVNSNDTTGQKTVVVGDYYVSETAIADYTASTSCVDNANQGISVNVGQDGKVAVGENQQIVCTITNARDKGGIKVNKLVDPQGDGTFEAASPGDFTWSLNGSGTNAMGSTVNNLNTGTGYQVNETSNAIGYEFVGWFINGTNNSCANPAGTTLPVSVSVTKNTTTEVTLCNHRPQGSVTILKKVIEYNQPAVDSTDWLFTVKDGDTQVGQVESGDSESFAVGSYTVTEEGINGVDEQLYELTGASGSCSLNQGVITLLVAGGSNDPCVITNTRKTGTIIVKKDVVNDNGGDKDYTDFHFKVNGGSAQNFNADISDTDGDDGTYTLTLPLGSGPYTIVEPEANSDGYTTSYSNCTALSVVEGQPQICIITNNDQPGKIIVHKDLTKNHGGSETVEDFSIKLNGTGGSVYFNENGTVEFDNLSSGSYYVGEDEYVVQVGGIDTTPYTQDDSNCQNLNIVNGQTVHCTIYNVDQPKFDVCHATDSHSNPYVFIKVPVSAIDGVGGNDHYGQHTGPIWYPGIADHSWGDIIPPVASVPHEGRNWTEYGQYMLRNNCAQPTGEISGYKFEDINGDGNHDDGESELGGWTIFIDEDGDKQLDDGETSVVTDASDGSYTLSDLAMGTYSICEVQKAGWTQKLPTTGTCHSITLSQEDWIADGTNFGNQKRAKPTLIVKKTVVNDNGGQLTASNFGIKLGGTDVEFTSATGGNPDPTNYFSEPIIVEPNTDITLSELDVPGYTEGTWSCSNQQAGGLSVTLNLDYEANVTCQITNDDKPGKIVVVKKVTNDDGGKKKPHNFKFGVDNGRWQNFSYFGWNVVTVDAGTHTVVEKYDKGYAVKYHGCKDIEVKNGETRFCVIKNDDKPGILKVKKVLVGLDGTTVEDTYSDFEFSVNGGEWQSFEDDGMNKLVVDAGKYWIRENEPESEYPYKTVYWNCGEEPASGEVVLFAALDSKAGQHTGRSLYVGNGQKQTCYIYNILKKVDLVIDKSDAEAITEAEEQYEYTIDVSNKEAEHGGFEATEVRVTDTLDSNLKFVSYNGTDWTCVHSGEEYGGTLTCDYTLALAAGESAPTITVVVEVSADVEVDEILNEAAVTSKEYEINSEDNSDSEQTPVKRLVGTVEAVCINDFPYLRWNVEAINFTPLQFTIEWFTADGNEAGVPAGTLVDTQTIELSEVKFDGTSYSATTLWPGANDDPANPDWPGWKKENGKWVADPSDFGASLRPSASVVLSSNPSTEGGQVYPPATPECDANPTNPPAVLGTVTTPKQLFKTGSEILVQVIAAVSVVIIAVFVASRRQHTRTSDSN